MKTQTSSSSTKINGIDTEALRGTIAAVTKDPAQGMTYWAVASKWRGGARSDTRPTGCTVGGKPIARDFNLSIDEPAEFCGTDKFANPQEYLLAALNACMIVTYVSYCSLEGIELEDLRIETEGNIDLRGLFGLDPSVSAGYDQLRYTVYIKGNGTLEQFEKIHRTVMAASPNYFNLANAVHMKPRLVIGTEKSRAANGQLAAA
ncbi:hypothetical protein AYO49_00205 [Verrucomicrobiaceae bacterium SCGC AG-212-N21]|nr:hypothetical protein AYO49_00205 [Verrucomicrobiaceae bacterium SCGC AG-212-N21]